MENEGKLYWAAEDTLACADEIIQRVDDYYEFCMSKGFFSLWRNSFYSYNPNRYNSGRTLLGGESNEFRVLQVNHYRNLIEHIQNLTITDRPVWKAVATNSDSRSQKQCVVAEGLLDYIMRSKRVERHIRDATRFSLLFGSGFVMQTWDPAAGKPVAADGQDTQHEGDLHFNSLQPVDIIIDPNLSSYSTRSWLIARTYQNKYDLAAKFPEYADVITSTQPYMMENKNHYLGSQFLDKSFDSDQIAVLNFFHEKSSALPNGRQMILLADGTALVDSPLLYDHIPIHRISPGDQVGSPMGQSVAFDLLPVCEMIDGTYSQILSVNEAYSIPKLILRHGSDIQPETLSTGIQVIKCSVGEEPKIMEMPTAEQGLYDAINMLERLLETLSGVNSVARGNPEKSLQSGSALALVESMAIQFHSPLQQSYIQLLEDVGTGSLQILQDYASTPRVVQIAGLRNKSIVQQSFSNKDIDSIARVTIQAGNPMSKTTSGKLQIAQELLKTGVIKTGQEYLQVLQTGNIDPLIQGDTAILLNVATENELLLGGSDIPVFFTDDHAFHISEHNALASDPAVRMEPELFAKIAKHITEHISMLSDPAYQNYRIITGQQTLPLPGQPIQPPGPGTAGPAGPEPLPGPLPSKPGLPQQAPMGTQAIQQKAATIQPPQPPMNKLTGQRAPLTQGV